MTRPPPDRDVLRGLGAAEPDARRALVATLARDGHDADVLIDALIDLLNQAAARGDALEPWLVAAEAVADHGGQPRQRSAVLRLRAWLATARDARHADALATCDEASALLDPNDAKDVLLAARIDATRVWPLVSLGRIDEALTASERAERTLRAADPGQPALYGLLMNRATGLNFAGRYAAALTALDAAAEVDRSAESMIDVALMRGLVLGNQGDLSTAAAVLAPLPAAAEAAGRLAVAARAQHNLGLVELRLGRSFAGLRTLYAARDKLAAAGDAAGANRVALAVIEGLLSVRRFDAAVVQARQLAEALPPSALRERAHVAYLDGVARAGLDDVQGAIARLTEARGGFEDAGLPHWRAAADRELALLALRAGDAEGALVCGTAATEGAEEAGEAYDAALSRLTVARALHAAGRPGAGALLSELADVASERDWPRLAFRVEAQAGAVAVARGDLATAERRFERAMAIVEWTEGQLLLDDRPSFMDDKGAVYHHLTAIHLDAGRIVPALAVAERGKARALVALRAHGRPTDEPTTATSNSALVDGAATRADAVLKARRALIADVRGGGGTSDVTALWAMEEDLALRWHRARIGSGRAVDDAAAMAAPGALGPRSSARAHIPLDGRARAMPDVLAPSTSPADAIVSYAALPEGGLAAFTLRDGRWSGRRLTVGLADVAAQVNRLHRQLATAATLPEPMLAASAARLRIVLARLWEALVEPLDLPASCTRITIAPCGPLNHVPFAALWDGQRYLVERASVRLVPTIGLPEPRSVGRGAAVLGCSLHGALPATTREATAVAATLGVEPLLEEQATRQALQAALASRGLVHAAVHAMQRPDSPSLASLALADGDLTALELYDTPIVADLVVLAGCDTAAVVPTGADEPLGMTHALLAAGAGSVIASLWAVHDDTSVALMTALHQGLAAGQAREAALASAQRSMLAMPESRGAHPFHWACLQLVGRGGPLVDGIGSSQYST